MKTVKLSELFDIERGIRLTKADQEPGDIPLVTAGEDNYGINGYISNGKSKLFKNAITVDMFCYAVYRDYEFYCDDNIIVLIPKEKMELNELLYYSLCICQNKFKFGYGRQLRLSRLDEIKLPAKIPDWVYTTETPDIEPYRDQIDKYLRDENNKLTIKPDKLYDLIKSGFFDKNEPFNDSPTPELNTDSWKEFKLTDLFDIVKGNNATQSGPEKTYPYISSSSTNNGISDYRESDKYHPGGLLTVSANGACMDTFYQSKDFISCSDVNVLYPKTDNFNKYNAMFFIPILELEKFRFGYGRKSSLERVKQLIIKLPATPEGEPDYQFMEDYIKTLPYSKYI